MRDSATRRGEGRSMVIDNARVKVAQLESPYREDNLISLFVNSTRKKRGGRRARPESLQPEIVEHGTVDSQIRGYNQT